MEICVCRGKFLRSGALIYSSSVISYKSAGVSFHDFRHGFRIGTFVCSRHTTGGVGSTFLRSRGRYHLLGLRA